MPLLQTLFTGQALNQANFPSPAAFTDIRTGQPVYSGGLNLGDYFDLTDQEAYNLSNIQVGRLFGGRYRFVGVDLNATQANVGTGLVGAFVPGSQVQQAVTLTPGSGQTAGSYQLQATGGGGSGAAIQVLVNAAGTVTSQPILLSAGLGYTSTPTFTLAAGGTPATFAAQMTASSNFLTSYDKASAADLIRGVFLNPITPGNFGFIQELGVASVLGNATIGSATVGALVNAAAGGTVGTAVGTGSPTGLTLGKALDLPVASALFRALLTLPVLQG
jgi:hypothetical protein